MVLKQGSNWLLMMLLLLQLIHIIMMMMFILTLISLLAVSLQTTTLYFSLPFHTLLNHTSAYHLVPVQINRYPYLIDFTLETTEDRILSVQAASQGRKQVDRPDYRKNEESIFGVIEFYGTQRADARVEWKRKTLYNAYYSARDFLTRETWLSLNGIQQMPEMDGPAEGVFNFGPGNSNSQILRNFRKYSKYMGDTVITWRGGDAQQNGEVFFGTFPTDIVQNGEVFTSALDYMGLEHWTVNTIALQLRRKASSSVELYRQSIKMRLSLSERTIVIPLNSAQTLAKSMPKCSFQETTQNDLRGKYLQCKDLKQGEFSSFALQFTLRDSSLPLSIRLLDLYLSEEEGKQWFAVRASESQDYQIGQAILRNFAVGIDYRQARLLYGPLAATPVLTRNVLLNGFLWGNLLLFLCSLVVVLMEKRLREKMAVSVREELGVAEDQQPSKANSYELANVTEDSLAQ